MCFVSLSKKYLLAKWGGIVLFSLGMALLVGDLLSIFLFRFDALVHSWLTGVSFGDPGDILFVLVAGAISIVGQHLLFTVAEEISWDIQTSKHSQSAT
jgi:hypothetical protein